MESLKQWDKADYLTEAPYEALYALRGDVFAHQARLEEMAAEAASAGFRTFKAMYKQYKAKKNDRAGGSNVTEFSGQPMELETGAWKADDLGITTQEQYTEVVACVHPIMPVCRLVNVDTGLEKAEIAFRKGNAWRRIVVDKRAIASANSIISLSDNGVAVTSENARHLVRYLHDVENYNYDQIPQKPSVGRLGYIEGEGFSPYVDGLMFDGDANFRTIFHSVRSAGSLEEWTSTIAEVRQHSVAAKIVVAASFASVLVHPIGALPFFVHLWGSESGTGKTVALMAAASVWADPMVGKYIQTFNGTSVGQERLAAFLNSLPVIVDELQLAKDAHGKLVFDVYKLAEGVGKTRGNRGGGIDLTPTWQNCILTSGESPITADNAGAGAKNRVLEIECTADKKIVENGHKTAQALKKNYGFAGRAFVEYLRSDEAISLAKLWYKNAFDYLSASDTTDKQAMAAALVLAADMAACNAGILPGAPLDVREIAEFLRTNAEVDVNRRAYDWLVDWVASNAGNFCADMGDAAVFNTFGSIEHNVRDGDIAYIIRSVFARAVEDAGFSSSALLSWMKKKDLIIVRKTGRAFTVPKRVNSIPTECVALRLPLD